MKNNVVHWTSLLALLISSASSGSADDAVCRHDSVDSVYTLNDVPFANGVPHAAGPASGNGLAVSALADVPQPYVPDEPLPEAEAMSPAEQDTGLPGSEVYRGCGGCRCGGSCGADASCWDEILSAGDAYKEMRLGPLSSFVCLEECTLSIGGELRYRYMDEDNRLRPDGPARSTYDLWRWRNHVDFRNSDDLRIYVEMIDASIFNQEMPPVPIDVNRADILQAFVDVKIGERDGRPIVVRTGRQFLQYGSERLVSPLGWSNTFRNFEGIKVFIPGETWDVDAFLTRPVNGAAGNLYHPTSRDHADASRTFSGVYATYHGVENNVVDLYWLWLREQEPVPTLMDGSRHTVGARWAGKHPIVDCCGEAHRVWSWDIEGAFQFGHDNDLLGVEQNVVAGFFTAVAGHTWAALPWSPKLDGLFHWGSGDDDPTSGDIHTVSTLFPLGHAYWGLIDNLAGQNLIDYSIQGSVKPADNLTLAAAMHWFNLDEGADRVYNVVGAALGPGSTGSNVGQEFDLVGTYNVHENLSVQLGYFWFWYGDAVSNGPLSRGDASQLYVMTTLAY